MRSLDGEFKTIETITKDENKMGIDCTKFMENCHEFL